MTDPAFHQLVDVTMVRHLLESHQRLSGMACGLFDVDGNEIVSVGWQDICVRFHRVHPVACGCCRESNLIINSCLQEGVESFVEYRCPNGMIDAAMPIVINGRHLASFYIGQFFYDDDPPDREFFIARAAECGFDRESYLSALDRVPLFTRKHVRNNLPFLDEMVQLLTKTGTDNLQHIQRKKEKSVCWET